jgi:hypothetical protein
VSGERKNVVLFKKSSKNFCELAGRLSQHSAQKEQKFFGSFFQKRTLASCFTPPKQR